MAKKAQAGKTQGYREILADIEAGRFAPVYVLSGKEAYYIDLITDAIDKHAVAPEDRDFDCNIFYGPDSNLDEVMAAARQFSMMSPRRLVMLKEAQGVHGGRPALDKLAMYVANPTPGTVFVVAYKGENINATSQLAKAAQAVGGVIYRSEEVREQDLRGPILDYCQARRLNIDEKSIGMLAEYIGNSLSKIFGEIDKLLIAAPPGTTRITPELIERNIGVSKDYNNFELTRALSQNNYTRAMKIVDYFARNPNKKENRIEVTLGVLFAFYRKLAICLFTPDKSDAGLVAATGVKSSYALREVKDAMRHTSPGKVVRCIHAIRECDAQTKGIGSMQHGPDLLKELIFKLFTMR